MVRKILSVVIPRFPDGTPKRLLEIVGVVLDEQEREFKYKIKLAYRRDKTRLREYLYKLDKVQKLDLSEMTLREIVDFDLMKYF